MEKVNVADAAGMSLCHAITQLWNTAPSRLPYRYRSGMFPTGRTSP